MSSASDVIELTDFGGDVDLAAVSGGQQAVALKVIDAGAGVLVIRTHGGDRMLSVAAGDAIELPISHVLATSTVAKIHVAFGAP